MVILGIDTSTSAIAVAVGQATPAGVEVLGRAARIDARGHSEHLAPLIDALLQDQGLTPRDLTAIVVGNGPGPFTGLRVGIVTGLVMGEALGIPVHGLCSLDALAARAAADALVGEGEELVVASDARRKEVYWARYAVRSGTIDRLTGPWVDRPADLPEDVRALPTVGRGPLLHPEWLANPVGNVLDVDAGDLVTRAGELLSAGLALPVEPLYLRRPDALTTAERAQR